MFVLQSIYDLLVSKREQERALLSLLINKLGDIDPVCFFFLFFVFCFLFFVFCFLFFVFCFLIFVCFFFLSFFPSSLFFITESRK